MFIFLIDDKHMVTNKKVEKITIHFTFFFLFRELIKKVHGILIIIKSLIILFKCNFLITQQSHNPHQSRHIFVVYVQFLVSNFIFYHQFYI